MKANTYAETYEQTVESYLIPYFRDALLTKIKSGDIQVFFNIMSAKYSQSVLDKMRLCLYGIFDTAIDNDLCYKNPVTHLVTHLCQFLCNFIRLLFCDTRKRKNPQLSPKTVDNQGIYRLVGGGGFGPPKLKSNRFTVCPLWPLGNSPFYLFNTENKVF